MENTLKKKEKTLRQLLGGYGTLAVSFSGGVDSTLLLALAAEELPGRVLAVTEVNELYPARESQEAVDFCAERGIPQVTIHHSPEEIPGFCENPRNRCYLCKTVLFRQIQQAADRQAAELGILPAAGHIVCAEGSNVSDLDDYRPGAQAVKEQGFVSPFLQAGFTKQDIRDLSRQLGLPTAEKPSFACLASRFVYGERITLELLDRVDKAEQLLIDAGFTQVRVRIHDQGNLARVEVPAVQVPAAFKYLHAEGGRFKLHDLGFVHVSLDMDGYRTGSMNE